MSSCEASAPPSYPGLSQNSEDLMLSKFSAICNRYEISDYFARKLRQLEGFEIVLIIDDSGSMATPLAMTSSVGGSPFGKTVTRWDELKSSVGIIVEMATIMDKDGIDIYFLNRPNLHNVTSPSQLQSVFDQPPAGYTPTVPVLRRVFADKRVISTEKKVLVILMTDGQPTNPSGESDIAMFKNVLLKERNTDRFYVTIVACTDDDQTMDYLNDWDTIIPRLDVVDDYISERTQIQKVQGAGFAFSIGSYISKIMLGSIDPEVDALDEVRQGPGAKPHHQPYCSIQ